jgi:hypothetical protein
MYRRFVILGAVLSGTGAVLALFYRSAYVKRKIRRLLGYVCDDDSLSGDGSEKVDISSQVTRSRGYAGATKDTPLLAMEEVIIGSS